MDYMKLLSQRVKIGFTVCLIAVDKNILKANPLADCTDEIDIHTARLSDVNILKKRVLSGSELLQIYKISVEKILFGSFEYIANLVRLFAGVSPECVAALQWRDYIYDENFSLHYLYIRRYQRNKQPIENLHPSKIHKIPCGEVLAYWLTYVYQQLISQFGLDEMPNLHIVQIKKTGTFQDANRSDIVTLGNDVLASILTPKQLHISLGMDEDSIVIPSGLHSGIDLYRSTYKHILGSFLPNCDNAFNYLLGITPNTVTAKHYVDYGSNGSLFFLRQYQNAIECKIFESNLKLIPFSYNTPNKDEFCLPNHSTVLVQFEANENGQILFETETESTKITLKDWS